MNNDAAPSEHVYTGAGGGPSRTTSATASCLNCFEYVRRMADSIGLTALSVTFYTDLVAIAERLIYLELEQRDVSKNGYYEFVRPH